MKDNQAGEKMEGFNIDEKNKMSDKIFAPKIKVVGVGGAGCNMLSHLLSQNEDLDIEAVAINTDKQALDQMDDSNGRIQKVQIGKKLTKGLG